MRFLLFLAISTLCFHSVVNGQSYFTNGNARTLGNECYELTSQSNWQLGSVWYADKIDLSEDFDLEFELYFGTRDQGADGIVFVLQTVGNQALGKAGGGIGFEGFSPSLGVEFDDWNNVDQGDIEADHIAILKNGSVNHNGPDAISPPVPALVSSADIEDGNYHHVRITWSNTDRRLEVWFDCEKRQSIEIDIIKDIFNGKTEVYWGFTSATGGENNVHRACLSDDIISKDSVYLCKGRSIQLVAGESINENYKWTPNYFLSENNVQAPICSAEESTTYFANYTNKCNEEVIDTFHVEILPVPEIGLIEDIDLCRDVAQQVEIKSTGVSVTWNDDEVGGTFELLNYEGKVKVKSTNECGDDSTEFNVTLVECTCDIWFPNVFTPNDDLVNDKFGHLGECHGLLEYNLSIYNRWGELLFESDNVNEEWDAKVNLKDVPAGVYFWVASWKVENANGTSTELLSGMVEVIR